MKPGRVRAARAGRLAVLLAAIAGAALPWPGAGPGAARAQARTPVRVESLVSPDTVDVGGTVTVTWRVWLPRGSSVTFPGRPADDSLHHWLAWTPATRELKGEYREHRLTARFQTFALGDVRVPGTPVRFTVPGEAERTGAFPVAGFVVRASLPAGGPDPPLKDIHGLVAPPWWATVPWWWIAAGLAALLLVVLVVHRLMRRRPRPAQRAVPEAPLEAPEKEARRRLAALVALRLPEEGRTYEHGTELADLLRRFVERRFGSLDPGDTTGELVRRLEARAILAPADVTALRGILDACDLTKFARQPYDAPRAHQAEAVAGTLIDRWAAPEPAAGAVPAAAPKAGAA